MKQILFLTWVCLLAFPVAKAQLSTSEKLYAQLDGASGVTIVSLSKDVIDLVDMVVDDEESKQVTGPLEKVKLMICEKDKAASSVGAIVKTLNGRPFKEIEDDDMDEESKVFVVRSGKKIKECHVVNNDDDALFMLSFYGDFRVEDIDKMVAEADDMR
ncbi:DUF4252 domain-containing protein [Anaerophaga thermohalophila]|jgi:hypothetical protein|uniref:DUF4252 domain-containing protein n=1 Tax=Anaerophaga thermohalophila TaxID=177400 RepID=UPI00030C03B3|nr:DUF4252 domain-containing protein [Anaerophaga thermohalophila]